MVFLSRGKKEIDLSGACLSANEDNVEQKRVR